MYANIELYVLAGTIVVILLLVMQALTLGNLPKYTYQGIDFRNMPTDLSSVKQIRWIQKEYAKVHGNKCTMGYAAKLLNGWEQSSGYKIHHGEVNSV